MNDVVIDRKGDVLWLRLDRPERMNAYDRGTIDELIGALRDHVDARVTVITGNDGPSAPVATWPTWRIPISGS